MSVTRLRFTKSETRDLAERDHLQMVRFSFGEPTEWSTSNSAFFTAFVVILALLATLALVLR